MTPAVTTNGIINKPSSHSVDQTVEKLRSILQSKGVTLFALVDHSREAAKVGMKMRPTKLLIFGSPKAGTPLMLASPSRAIDLPLKLLIWEDAQSKVWISYNDPVYLQHRHGLPQELLQNITVAEALAEKALLTNPLENHRSTYRDVGTLKWGERSAKRAASGSIWAALALTPTRDGDFLSGRRKRSEAM